VPCRPAHVTFFNEELIERGSHGGADDAWPDFASGPSPDPNPSKSAASHQCGGKLGNYCRNPMRYTTFTDVRIGFAELEFKWMPDVKDAADMRELIAREAPVPWPPSILTIPEAKKALAARFGVNPDCVEFTIRG
jgi:hypothetical protein